MNLRISTAAAAVALTLAGTAIAATDPMVGGAAMFDNKN